MFMYPVFLSFLGAFYKDVSTVGSYLQDIGGGDLAGSWMEGNIWIVNNRGFQISSPYIIMHERNPRFIQISSLMVSQLTAATAAQEKEQRK